MIDPPPPCFAQATARPLGQTQHVLTSSTQKSSFCAHTACIPHPGQPPQRPLSRVLPVRRAAGAWERAPPGRPRGFHDEAFSRQRAVTALRPLASGVRGGGASPGEEGRAAATTSCRRSLPFARPEQDSTPKLCGRAGATVQTREAREGGMRTRQQRSARGGVDAGGDSAEALASPSPQAATPSPPRVVPTPQRWAHDQVDLQPTRCKGGVGMLGRAQWLPLPRKAVYELLCRSDVGATRWQRRAGVGACTCNLIPCSGPCPPPPAQCCTLTCCCCSPTPPPPRNRHHVWRQPPHLSARAFR